MIFDDDNREITETGGRHEARFYDDMRILQFA